ncbi:purine-cytosine permease family protein [Sinomonas sp.]|jgi:purine-cytosine permease-like protein|uniref:purine-cytosine permease family protein n=1 Tax=Sinomonas sp. TaxID=1914986 RepID=UPI002FE1AEE2
MSRSPESTAARGAAPSSVEATALGGGHDEAQRTYQGAAANETLEDYSLRFAPVSFRKWTPFVVATTAIGGIAYLADFSIGASIVLTNGAASGITAILAAAVIIFLTGIPIARACAKYGVDMDLLTRGAGFGYFGSTLTSVIYASFTFIFFALEGSIMAQGFQYAIGLPLWAGYLVTSLLIVPIVVFGMKAISKLHVWTQPVWLLLLVLPFVLIMVQRPGALSDLMGFAGTDGGEKPFSWQGFGLGMGVALSLIAQIGEQADYLRFMPVKTKENSRAWNTAVTVAGPGWVVLGAAKQIGGALLAVAVLTAGGSDATALEPIHQYSNAIAPFLGDFTVLVSAVFVIMSQIKINTTNAYSGSLSWSNFFSRLTHRHPGRVYYVLLNVGIALVLMEMNMFSFLNTILGFYSNVGIAWVGAVCADLLINKPLGLSPRYIEFKRAYLYSINPVGFGSMVIASLVSVLAFFKVFGDGWTYAFSPLIALLIAMVLSPVIAIATKGKYYLARPNLVSGPASPRADASEEVECAVCSTSYERPDIADCTMTGKGVCSLCCSLEKSCHDLCKKPAGAKAVPLGMPAIGSA